MVANDKTILGAGVPLAGTSVGLLMPVSQCS